MYKCILAILLLSSLPVAAGSIPVLERLHAQSGTPAEAQMAEQMRLLREAALKHDVVSGPVSDRYIITELGGPIDVVHFLGLAIQVQRGKDLDEALWEQYVLEGGIDFEKGLTDAYLSEAHPDDLPSNALGALFAKELAAQPDAQLLPAMTAFLLPLRPLPDAVAKKYHHDQVVLGLPGIEKKRVRERHEWFTARPLLVARLIKDPHKQPTNVQAELALADAGFAVATIKGRPIKIVRVKP